jgi:hypothetical protein
MVCLLSGCSSSAESAEVDAAPDTIVAVDAPSTEDTAAADSSFMEAAADTTPADTTPADTTADTALTDSATDETSDGGGIHYDPTVFALFSKSCATSGCHIGTAPAGSLNLADAKKGYDALLSTSLEMPSKKLVVPFNPTASWLTSKLDHVMPTPLTSAEKKLVVTWIEEGALY